MPVSPRITPASRALGELVPPAGPERRLALGVLVNTTGNGLYLAGGAIFLTRSAGVPAAQVGLGLTLAGLVALGVGVVVGERADRTGVRRVYLASLVLEAAAMASLVLVHSFAVFLIAALLGASGDAASSTSRGALIAQIGGAEGRVALRARLRAITNVGVSIGALLGGLALAIDTRAGYVGMVLLDAATFLLTAALVRGLPGFPPTRSRLAAGERRWIALTDRPYLAVTAINAVITISYGVLTIAVPLWVAGHTDAPRWVVAPLLLVNTVVIVALQVRASRDVGSPARAAVATRRAGLLFPAGWLLVGLAGGAPAGVALALLTLGVLIHTGGELLAAAGSFELSFSLARPDAQGQYQGVFSIGMSLGKTTAPLLATGVVIALGLAGWIALGLVMAAAGALMPAASAAAERAQARRSAAAFLAIDQRCVSLEPS